MKSHPIVFAGPPYPDEVHHFKVTSGEQLLKTLVDHPASVVVVPHKQRWLSEEGLSDLMTRFPALWIVGTEGFEVSDLISFQNTGKLRRFLKTGEDSFAAALEVAKEKPHRVLAPKKRAGETLLKVNERLKALTQAIIGIQRANSIGEIEVVLNDALKSAMQLSWVRILFTHQSSLLESTEAEIAAFDFFLNEERLRGQILFGRENGLKFRASETQFLSEITDTTSLALERLGKIDVADTLKEQWEATFDAIAHPFCITSDDHVILRTNRAFSKVTDTSFRELVGQDAFEMFFGPNRPTYPEDASWSLRFSRGEGIRKTEFDVIGQSLDFELDGSRTVLLLFQDVSEQQKLERRIFESSKLAELGTIASSIAHELNNPLGGILSYLQLIRMDLPTANPVYNDVMEMELATLRCRDIIQNLLGFARVQRSEVAEKMDLRDSVERAVKLIELQSRSKGISVQVYLPETECLISGRRNVLTQAFCNILQNAIDAVSEKMRDDRAFDPKVEIEVKSSIKGFDVSISDDGLGMSEENQTQMFTPFFTTKTAQSNSGLGLTVAYAILQDHHATVGIVSALGVGTKVALTFPPFIEGPDK